MSSSKLKSKSPAEFFAEHQNIAGFDNPGKSLYTTIREFVENSLDASEALNVLPDIQVSVVKLAPDSFNELRGIKNTVRSDHSLYAVEKSKSKNKKPNELFSLSQSSMTSQEEHKEIHKEIHKEKDDDDKKALHYFRITCRDNGVGMAHDKIPQMLGVVLSSTKYGVKQTRGKFGLGAKMALVWSKKSTGLPIEVWSSNNSHKQISYCKLDIDIYKNEPRIIKHEHRPNPDQWRGTEISVVIGGKWVGYQSKVVDYLRQLAVITPYAAFNLSYTDEVDDKKTFTLNFRRRTDVMPPEPKEMKHHPSSVDNLLVEQLIHQSKAKNLKTFLKSDFSNISAALAERLVEELGKSFRSDMEIQELSKKEIHQLTQLLREAKFAPPDASCLSPAGEYNLRLGIMKELQPDLIATASSTAAVIEGHPFIVEAAVALGGKTKTQGVTVYRFANRIPLLFDGGSDVATTVAQKLVKWSSYKMNNKTDKIGVFVSIVSTKIPFKGTSKEYVGDDKGPLHDAILKAIKQCCSQLKRRITSQHMASELADRKKQLSKFIPDVSRALIGVLSSMADPQIGSVMLGQHAKRRKMNDQSTLKLEEVPEHEKQTAMQLIQQVESGELTEEVLEAKLTSHVDLVDAELALEHVTSTGREESGGGRDIFFAPLDTSKLDSMICVPEFKIFFSSKLLKK